MAKTTYTRTLFIKNLQEAEVVIYSFEKTKYEINDTYTETRYTGLTSWDIIEGGKEAEEIEKDLAPEQIDENHEYLVLHFNTLETATYRNSHVQMFIR